MTTRLSELTKQNKSPALLHERNWQALYFDFVSVSHYYIRNPLQALHTHRRWVQCKKAKTAAPKEHPADRTWSYSYYLSFNPMMRKKMVTHKTITSQPHFLY